MLPPGGSFTDVASCKTLPLLSLLEHLHSGVLWPRLIRMGRQPHLFNVGNNAEKNSGGSWAIFYGRRRSSRQHRPGPARLLSTVPVRGSCKRTTVGARAISAESRRRGQRC